MWKISIQTMNVLVISDVPIEIGWTKCWQVHKKRSQHNLVNTLSSFSNLKQFSSF